ncbi:hypothetical protein AABB24_026930 [Solanum stoloniferum]|uniref:AIPP2-like SPOC-like domain-containing protein n=1 Tax=Solanum stoloniferum TaxID=62892 RepID=A0ABD2SGZ1_9SOLN
MDWCCEECHIGKRVISSSCGLENDNCEGSRLHALEKICRSTVQPKKHSTFPGRHYINWEKEVQTGKTRYLPVEEALGLSSGIKKYGSPLINTGSSRVVSTKSMATVTRGNFSKPRAQISNSFPEKSTVQRSLGSGYTKPQNPQNAKITEQSKRQVQSSKGLGGSAILEHRSPYAVNESQMINPSTTHPCDPALVPSWKSEIYIALVEFMRLKDLVMKTLINDVELLILPSTALCSDSQRWNRKHFLWGLFYHMGQDTDGCAEGGSNKVIDMEIDMIGGKDVCTINEVDMEAYHQNEVEMQIDMTGQEDVCTPNKVDMEGYQDEVEMEIDMIAGENVGTLDIVVSTTTRNGFDTSIKETVTAATCSGSESITPMVSRTSKGCKELLLVIKREPVDDFPPGFIPRSAPTK